MHDDDVEIDDRPCPACGHEYTHFRRCGDCEDGYVDCHDDDPINCVPGEEYEPCPECNGRHVFHWCPKCGKDYDHELKEAIKAGTIVRCGACGRRGDDECRKCWGNGWRRVNEAATGGQRAN